MGVAACTATPPPAKPIPAVVAEPPVEPDPVPPEPAWSEAAYLAELLEQAEVALKQDRLLVPEAGSAFALYREVLRSDPRNPIAHAGMQRITERYFELAEANWRVGNVSEAELMLRRAQDVAATPAQVARLKASWPAPPKRVEPKLPSNSFGLSTEALSERGPAIQSRLREVAERAQTADSRLLIVARNDAEGRWIYQQMREAVTGYRLRGNIQIGAQPRVVLIDLEE